MGLDTTHECWQGSYGAFGRWRDALARAAGYGFREEPHYPFPPYTQPIMYKVVDIEWPQSHIHHCYSGEWPETPEDPLLVLIMHSDCDGVIQPDQAGSLADRMEALIPSLEDYPGEGEFLPLDWWRKKTRQFIEGLREAAEANEPVQFY